MKRFVVLIALIVLLCGAALAADAPGILPQIFGGWEKSASPQTSKDPAAADPTNAAVLKEYNFSDFESATYTRDGRKMTVKAARFSDASGAYGAFTFYKEPQMETEKIGDQGASAYERVMFYRGNVLVQATLDRVTAMTAGELRELAGQIPLPSGPARNLPVLPTYLPRQAYVKNSAKYVLGPVGFGSIAAPISAEAIDFSRGAEVVLGRYTSGQGGASLLLISYPTPQIAGEKLRGFENMIQSRQPGAAEATPVAAKRSGPMVAVVAGQISEGEAKSLLASVNYDAEVTWNEGVFLGKKNNAGNLIVNAILLTGIILGMCVVAGIAFGGVRILLKRLYPDRVFDRPQDVEIIRLNLRG
jgi:hypothetical protein